MSRENTVDVAGSKAGEEEEFWNRSRPANAPARPTVPMRSKLTSGRVAKATFAKRENTRTREEEVVNITRKKRTYAGDYVGIGLAILENASRKVADGEGCNKYKYRI